MHILTDPRICAGLVDASAFIDTVRADNKAHDAKIGI